MKIVSLSQGAMSLVSAFSALPRAARRDPFRVGLLPDVVWTSFMLQPTPFAREFWVAFDGNRAVARVGASISYSRPGEGAIGFFEADLTHPGAREASLELIHAAKAWLKTEGVAYAHGPLNFNTWFPYRFRAGQGEKASFERRANEHGLWHADGERFFAWEPVNPPEYLDIFADSGFVPLESYHTQGLDDLKGYVEKTLPSYEKARDAGFRFRPFDASRLLEQEVPLLYEISMSGFKNAFLFEPIAPEAFKQLYIPIADKKMDLSLSHFVVSPAGEEVGYFFAFPDQGYMVMKSASVRPEARGQGLSNALSYLAAARALEMGINRFITALVRTGNQSESYAKKAELLWEHRYILLTTKL
jgi:ribosomal protein S18 acetylase RimI-like enzyme